MVTCETLTVAFAEPLNLYFYTLGNYRDPIPPGLCQANRLFQDVLPVTFHTASLWLTVALAAHRYLFMRSALLSKRHQSFRSTVIVVVAILVCAAIPQCVLLLDSCVSVPSHSEAADAIAPEQKLAAKRSFMRAMENSTETLDATSYSWLGVVTKLETPNGTHASGSVQVTPCWLIRTDMFAIIMTSYYSFRAIMVHAVPCLMLVVLNVCLMVTVRSAENRRKSLFSQNGGRAGSTAALENAAQMSPGPHARAQIRSRRRATAETNTTLMLVIVVLVFLAVEGPSAVVIVLFTMASMGIIDPQVKPPAEVIFICNSAVIFSYPFTFFIYCTMSYQFRITFLRKLSQLMPFLASFLEHLNPAGMLPGNGGGGTTMNEQDLPLTSADVSRIISPGSPCGRTTSTAVANINRAHSMSDASPRFSRHSSLGVYAHIHNHSGHGAHNGANGSRHSRTSLLSPPSLSVSNSSQRPSPQLEHNTATARRLDHSLRE